MGSITEKITGKVKDTALKGTKKGIKEYGKVKLNTSKDQGLQTANMLANMSGKVNTSTPLVGAIQKKKQLEHKSGIAEAASKGEYMPTANESKEVKASLNLSESSKERLKRIRDEMKGLSKVADVGSAMMMGAGTALGAAGIGAAAHGGKKLLQRGRGEITWQKIKRERPELTDEKSRENFKVLLDFAPSLAKNKQVAMSYLERARQTHITPHEFVKELTQTQSNIDKSGPQVDPNKSMQTGARMSSDMSKSSSLKGFEQELNDLDPR